MSSWRKEYCLGFLRYAAMLEVAVLSTLAVAAQADGNAGINQANSMIRSYFPAATALMYGIAAIMALIGAVDVFMKMHQGREVGRSIAIWFGGCIFLAVVATVIQSFFGL